MNNQDFRVELPLNSKSQNSIVTMIFLSFGFILPCFVMLGIFILGSMKTDYSHIDHTISELGETGSNVATEAAIFFVLWGLLSIGFAYGLFRQTEKTQYYWVTPLLIVINGVFDEIGSGLFPTDPGGEIVTINGAIHLIVSLIGVLAIMSAPFMFAIYLKQKSDSTNWNQLQSYSKFFGISLMIASLLLLITESIKTGIGLAQRILVFLFLAWMILITFKLIKEENLVNH